MGVKMSHTSLIIISVISMMFLNNRVTAQSGCTMAIMSLSPCLNYVTGNSSTPSSSCCSRLSSLVDSQPQCLCALLKGGASSLGIAINQTLALALPAACNVQTPPISQCNAVNGPANAGPAPALSPSDDGTSDDDIPTTPSDSDIPSGTGSKTDSGTDGSSVGGSNNGATSLSSVGLLLLLASSFAFS